MPNKFNYDFLNKAKTMPPLKHKFADEDFDMDKSEVVKWLLSVPEIKQKIFDMANYRKIIIYDAVSKRWRGVDYHED